MRVNRDAVPFYNATVDGTVQALSAVPCYLQTMYVKNGDAAVRYLQIFNIVAADVVLGTTVPTFVIPILASASELLNIHGGVFMSAGLSVACTTTSGGAGAATIDAMVSGIYSIL